VTLKRIQTVCAFIGTTIVVSIAAPASAQLHEVTRSNDPSFPIGFAASGAAYDPIHDCYFVVSGFPSVTGRFMNRDGVTIGALSLDAREGFAAVAYSPDINDGAGGFGGFLTIWALRGLPGLFGQIASLPRGLAGPVVTIRSAHPAWFDFKGGVAYSPVDHVFLVAAVEYPSGIENSVLPTRIVRLNQNGQPLDDIQLSPEGTCDNLEFEYRCNYVDVVWNPISNEFGVLYGDGPQRTLARISGNGAVLSRTPLGISQFWGALAVNAVTGNYLALGTDRIGSVTNGAEVSPGGAILARGVVDTTSVELGYVGTPPTRLSYSRASGTFLLGGSGEPTSSQRRLLELNQHGVPLAATFVVDSYATVIASHGAAPQWLTGTVTGTRYIIGTSTPFGGSDARLSNCATPDPFVALGGGRCINDGWYPPIAPPPLPPSPVPGGCLTPDPFVALGGGQCINGGWYPPIASAPPPPAPPLPGGCITPDPFVAFGGGTCANGGWRFPTVPAPPPPAPTPGGCITPDPFVALGGGRCVNGGWYPPGS
jgi:hypothetical protein